MRLALAWLVLLGCGDRNTSPPPRDEEPTPVTARPVVPRSAGQNIGADVPVDPPRTIEPKEARAAATFIVRTQKCRNNDYGQGNELGIDHELSRGVRKNMTKGAGSKRASAGSAFWSCESFVVRLIVP